jgi:hypothetical protein
MVNEIQLARLMIKGSTETGECVSCGGYTETAKETRLEKAYGDKFTDFSALIKQGGTHICTSCRELINKENRSKVIFFHSEEKELIRADFQKAYDIFLNPPKQSFVLSVPYSFKKHHLLYAGISTKEKMYIGSDDGTVTYMPAVHRKLHDLVLEAIKRGVPKQQMQAGNYSTPTVSKVGANFIQDLEYSIEEIRATGLLKMFFRLIPKQEKVSFDKEDNELIKEVDLRAGYLLASIAVASEIRRNRGLDFWNGIFARRTTRFASLNLTSFVERMCEALQVKTTDMSDIITKLKSYSEEEEKQISVAIREHTNIVLGVAYDTLKTNKKEGKGIEK